MLDPNPDPSSNQKRNDIENGQNSQNSNFVSSGNDSDHVLFLSEKVLVSSEKVLESITAIHNINEYLNEISSLNSKYCSEYNAIYKKYWSNENSKTEAENSNSKDKESSCNPNNPESSCNPHNPESSSNTGLETDMGILSLWIKQILKVENHSIYKKQEIFASQAPLLLSEIKEFLTPSATSNSLWAGAYKAMTMPTSRDPSGTLGKWETSFLKSNTKMIESKMRLEKLRTTLPLNEKKISKQEAIYNDMLIKWKLESDLFFKKVQEMNADYQTFVPLLMEKYLALEVSVVDVTCNCLEDIRRLVFGRKTQNEGHKIDNNQIIQMEPVHNPNLVPEIDAEGYTVLPQSYVDPFLSLIRKNSSDEEEEKNSKTIPIIQVLIKQEAIVDNKEQENVMETLAMKLAAPTSKFGSSSISSQTRRRFSSKPNISNSRDFETEGPASMLSKIPMNNVIEDGSNAIGITSEYLTNNKLDEVVSEEPGMGTLSILVEEKCNCVFAADGQIERILVTGEISLMYSNQKSDSEYHTKIPSILLIDNIQDDVVEKIAENTVYLYMIPEELHDTESTSKSCAFDVNIEGVDSELKRLTTSYADKTIRLPLLKYLVSNQKSVEKVPIVELRAFWKKDTNYVYLLITFKVSSEFRSVDRGEIEICAYVDGSSDVGTIVSEPLVEWDLDKRRVRWILAKRNIQEGRLVARIETSLDENDPIGEKPIDVGFKFNNVCIAGLVVDIRSQNDLEENHLCLEFVHQSGVFQCKGSHI